MKKRIRCAVWSSRKFVPQMFLSLSGIKTAHARSEKQIKSKFMKSKFHQVTHVRRQSVESVHTALNGHIHQIRELPPSDIVEGVVFRIEEHLRVQQDTERRAFELWCAGGCRDGTALVDWLQAEREVLEQFIEDYIRRHSWPRRSKPKSSLSFARRIPESRILKRGRTPAPEDSPASLELGKACRALATIQR
jgi:hypothetical protein